MDVARRSAWVVAAFAAALDLAAVVCAYGFVSLLTDVEVIASPEAGRLVGPAAIGASVAARAAHARAHPAPTRPHAGRASCSRRSGAGSPRSWSAAIGYAFATGTLTAAALFGLGFGIGWFGLLIPALAAVIASFAVLVARGRSTGMERPRWPWERDDEE